MGVTVNTKTGNGRMNTYENAPATKMLATHCVCCGRALVDATSVEMGIGPECREGAKGGFDDGQRQVANRLVFEAAIAAQEGKIAVLMERADQVAAIGYTELADKMRRRFVNAERNVSITITQVGDIYEVVTPYRRGAAKEFVAAWRTVPGRRWANGVNVVPVASKAALFEVLKKFFGGKFAKGPKGIFRIPSPEPPAQTVMKLV